MGRSSRMFEIIQLLRRAGGPLTAQALARSLEVTKRTIYRDIVSLQAMRVPIEGAAGVGYIMRSGFDLPPLMFTAEEVEAIVVGMSLLGRTGDAGLQRAAGSVAGKITEVLPDAAGLRLRNSALHVSRWNAVPAAEADLDLMRRAIRQEEKLRLVYGDADARRTERVVQPLAVIYYVDSIVLAGWCELRGDFRHFRADRMIGCAETGISFKGRGETLRAEWRARQETSPSL